MTQVDRPALAGSLHLPPRFLARPLPLEGADVDRWTVMAALIGIPIGLIGIDVFGFSIGGWAWAFAMGLGFMAAVSLPLIVRPLTRTTPLALYLAGSLASLAWTPDLLQGIQVTAQYLTVVVVYIVSYRMASGDPALLGKLQKWALFILPSAGFVFVRAFGDGVSTFGWIRGGNSARPMVMSVALLYLLATAGRSRKVAVSVGLVALFFAVGSGGRMGAAVTVLLLIFNPAMRITWRTRVVLMAAGVTLFAILLTFEPVQERFFVGREEGTFEDIVALENNFNTAGRSNNWPEIIRTCSPHGTLGFGAGATSGLTLEATHGRTGHPHNEFIRVFCEGGVVGSVLFWSFFLAAGIRGIRTYRRHGNEFGSLAALAVLALLMFSATDNATIYTSVFMAPLALILGLADSAQDAGLMTSSGLET